MSYFDERRNALGLNNSVSQGSGGDSNYFEKRKIQLGLKEDPLAEQKRQERQLGSQLFPFPTQEQLNFSNRIQEPTAEETFNKSPMKKLLSGTQNLISKIKIPENEVTRKVGEGLLGTRDSFIEKRQDIRSKQADTVLGRFAGGFDQGASLGLSSFLDKATGDFDTPEKIANSTAGKIGEVAGFVAPGSTAYKGAKLIKPLSKLTNKYGRVAAEGAIAGGIFETANESAQELLGTNDQSLKERLIDVGIGVGVGAAGDVALTGLGAAAKKIISKYRSTKATPQADALALPAPRERGNVNTAQTPDVVTPEYTFGLPDANPQTTQRLNNVAEGRADLKIINDELRQLEASYERAVVDEYKYLQQSLKERSGVQQGQLQTDIDGNVVGRSGRISNNPKWYQDFHARNNKVPSNKDLFKLARERVDNGFVDETGQIPGWRSQNHYDESLEALTDVRNTLQQSLRELDPALHVTDTPLVQRELSFTPVPKVKPVEVPMPKAPEVSTAPIADDVLLPRTKIAEGDASLGFSAFGKKGRKYTNPEDTRQYISTKTDREPWNVEKLADDFYKTNVDNMQRINQFDKYIEKATGKKLSAADRSYYLALNSKGADMTSKHILTERLVNPQGAVIGHSLKDITSQIPSNAYQNFVDYLIAKHAPTRMLRGERVYNPKAKMTIDKVEAKVAEYEQNYPQFKEISDQLYEWDSQLTQSWLVDTGIIPPEMAAAWKEANPYWSPNQRRFTKLEQRQQRGGAKRGFANQNNPVKKYSEAGSGRDIVDPIESRIEYVDRYVKTARRNEVMQTVYRQLQKHPDELDGFATILKREKLDPKTMDGEGLDGLITSLDDEFNKTLHKSDLTKDNVVSALVDGERVYMRVEDPDFLDALSNLTPQATHAIVEGARKATGAMKLLTTGVNPIFGLTRNIFRDIPEAYIYSKTTDNPFRFAFDMIEGFISVFADGGVSAINNSRTLQKVTPESFRAFLDKQAKLYKDYKAIGGGHSSPAAANRNLLAQTKRDLLPQNKKGAQIPARAWAALENLNNALESGPRIGEFKRSRKAGGDNYSSRVQGLFEAQDLTTNFKRHGQLVKDIDAFVPYMNAAVQGLDKFARAFKDRPVAVPAKALAVIAAPTIALFAHNHDNPAYQKLSNYNKDNFYLLPTTDGQFVKIPKPRELGVPFGGLLERTLRAWADDDPEAFRDFADTAKSMFAPPVIGRVLNAENPFLDTIAGPTLEVMANKNFTGAPIVPGYLEGLSPRHQYDANTSEVGKKVGDLLNVSPKQVDHLIRGYTGMIGQIGLPATTQGATLGDTLTKQVTADSVFSTDATKYFYELKDKLDMQYKDAKHTGEIPKGYNDDARKAMNTVADRMSEYSKAIREIDKMEMDKQDKKNIKRQLTSERNDLARNAYEAVRDAIKSAK